MILVLVHRHSGVEHDAQILDTEPGFRRILSVKFAFEVLSFDLESNELQLIKGGRVTRRFPWRVAPERLPRVRALHFAMSQAKGDRTRRRAF